MAQETIVAVYETAVHADAAVRALREANVPAAAISQHANSAGAMAGQDTAAGQRTGAPAREQGFWSKLIGAEPDRDTGVYDRSIEAGSVVVSVQVPSEHYDSVAAILEQHDPIDLDERAAQYGTTQTATHTTMPTTEQPMQARAAATTRDTATNDGTMQLSEETLAVGKRAINRGTTRIHRFVVETPVEEQVSLHDERVSIERRPVTDDRAPTDSFSDKTVEMTETAEEAVVSKTARVREEVAIRKDVTDCTETIKDTVRREDVEIEKVPGASTSQTVGTEDRMASPTGRPSKI
ncbi:YsnF/AvaK domain-containing protein [Lichenicoccus sp.]|uniref:YsnF/AvaK domain-containing protein n=1 Tax=Lichenicoccus sp. TaxID=2781899 RepID=UPI003D0B96A2